MIREFENLMYEYCGWEFVTWLDGGGVWNGSMDIEFIEWDTKCGGRIWLIVVIYIRWCGICLWLLLSNGLDSLNCGTVLFDSPVYNSSPTNYQSMLRSFVPSRRGKNPSNPFASSCTLPPFCIFSWILYLTVK